GRRSRRGLREAVERSREVRPTSPVAGAGNRGRRHPQRGGCVLRAEGPQQELDLFDRLRTGTTEPLIVEQATVTPSPLVARVAQPAPDVQPVAVAARTPPDDAGHHFLQDQQGPPPRVRGRAG